MIIDAEHFKGRFDEDGYVIVRNLMPLEIMNNAQTAIERLVAELAEERVATGRIPHSFKEEPFARRFKKIYENEPEAGPIQFTNQLHQSELYDLYSYPPILDLVQSYLGDEIRLLVYVVRMRAFRHQKYQSLWHQDAGYLGAGRGQSEYSDEAYAQLRYVNCWTPFQQVNTYNGCMEFIPGTHKLGVVKHVALPPYNYLHIDFELINPMIEAGKQVQIELDPGDIVFFHNLLFHQGQDNYSGQLRWSADFRYQDARQETLTNLKGHLIRSRSHPDKVVSSREDWARLGWT